MSIEQAKLTEKRTSRKLSRSSRTTQAAKKRNVSLLNTEDTPEKIYKRSNVFFSHKVELAKGGGGERYFRENLQGSNIVFCLQVLFCRRIQHSDIKFFSTDDIL